MKRLKIIVLVMCIIFMPLAINASISLMGGSSISGMFRLLGLIFNPTIVGDSIFWAGLTADGDGTDDDTFQLGKGVTLGTTPLVTMDKDGNFGVGLTSLTGRLSAKSDGVNPIFQLFDATGTEKVTVLSDGKLGVAKTNPGYPFEVNGNMRISAGSGGGLVFADGTTMTTAAATSTGYTSTTDLNFAADSDADGTGTMNFATHGVTRMSISNNGNISTIGSRTVMKTNVADADYGTSALTQDYIVAFTSLTASRTATISTEDVESGTTTQPRVMIVKDESGDADTYPITIVLENGGTIDGQTAYSINQAYGSVMIYLNGTNGFCY